MFSLPTILLMTVGAAALLTRTTQAGRSSLLHAELAHSAGYLLPATATVGIGTILREPPLVRAIPYGPPRTLPSGYTQRTRPSRPSPSSPSSSKLPSKLGVTHHGLHKLKQHQSVYDKVLVRASGNDPHHYYAQRQQPALREKSHHISKVGYRYEEDAGRNHLYNYYSSPNTPSEVSRTPVIVYQGVRPPVRYYQEPRPAPQPPTHPISHTSSNIDTLYINKDTSNNYKQHNNDNRIEVDFSGADPVFSPAKDSDWKPITAPVGILPGRSQPFSTSLWARRVDASKQVVTPNKTTESNSSSSVETSTMATERAEHPPASARQEQQHEAPPQQQQIQPSEEVVSAVVFVKQ